MNEEYIVKLNLDSSNFEKGMEKASQSASQLSQTLNGIQFKGKVFEKLNQYANGLKAIGNSISSQTSTEVSNLAAAVKELSSSNAAGKVLSSIANGAKDLSSVAPQIQESVSSIRKLKPALEELDGLKFPSLSGVASGAKTLSEIPVEGMEQVTRTLEAMNGFEAKMPSFTGLVNSVDKLSNMELAPALEHLKEFLTTLDQINVTAGNEGLKGFVSDLSTIARQAKATEKAVKEAMNPKQSQAPPKKRKTDPTAPTVDPDKANTPNQPAPPEKKKYDIIGKSLDALQAKGKNSAQVFANLSKDTNQAFSGIIAGLSQMSGMSGFASVASEIKAMASALGPVGSAAAVATIAVTKFAQACWELSGRGIQAGLKALPKYFQALINPIGTVEKGVNRVKLAMQDMTGGLYQVNVRNKGYLVELAEAFERLIRYRVLNTILKGVFDSVGIGITNLYYANSVFAASMDSVATSSQYLSNSIAAALAPAINALAPLIEFVVDKFVDFVNVINMVIASLTGQDTWQKAIRVPATYADALDDTAKSTKDADDAAKEYKKTLLGFDEINKLTEDSNKDKDKNKGGSGSKHPDYASMFTTEPVKLETAPWAKALTDWVNQIKDLAAKGDWTGVGNTLADGWGKAVDVLDAAITSPKFVGKINKAIDATTDAINGFFARMTFSDGTRDSIAERTGNLIGDAVALALNSIDRFMSSVNFHTVGQAIAQRINGTIKKLSTNDVNFGKVISDLLNAGIDSVGTFARSLDWSKIGKYIADNINSFFTGVDWAGAGSTAKNLIQGLVDMLYAAVTSIDSDSVAKAVRDFFAGLKGSDGEWSATGKKANGIISGILKIITSAINEVSKSDVEKAVREVLKEVDVAELGVTLLKIKVMGWSIQLQGANALAQGFLESITGSKNAGAVADLQLHGIKIDLTTTFDKVSGWIVEHWDKSVEWVKKISFELDGGKYLSQIEEELNKFINAFNKIPGINIPEINITGNLIDVKDKIPQDKKQVSAIAQFKEWGKGNTFKNTIPDMKAQFDSTSKGTSFSNTIKGMTASLEKKNELFSKTTGAMTANLSKKSEGFSKTTGAMTANLSKKSEGFSKTTGAMTANITKKKDSIPNDQKVLGGFTAKLNDIVSGISGIFGGKKAEGGLYSNGQWKPIQQFASGGYPSKSAQLFIAREAGPELVGTIGNRTAVVNNSQIVSSVAAGVAQSVYAVMKTLRNTVNVTVNTDTGAIARDMTDYLEKVVDDFKDVPAMMEKQLRESVRSATVGNPVYRPDDYHFRDAGSSSADYNRGETTLSRESVEAIAAAVSRAVGDKNVELKLDGKTIMRSTIRNIEDETIRTGRNPLLNYL